MGGYKTKMTLNKQILLEKQRYIPPRKKSIRKEGGKDRHDPTDEDIDQIYS